MDISGSEWDNKSLGSEEDFNLNCQPCYRDGDEVRAHGYCIECEEHLCVTCFKFHRRTVFTRDHTLLDTLSMPRKAVKTVKKPNNLSEQTDAFTEACSDHKNKYIEYYCPIHRYLGCSVCVTLNHKQCDSVRFIPDIADKNEVYASFVQTIDSLSQEFKTIKHVSETNASEAKTIHSKAKQDKDEFRKDINSKLDLLDDDIDNEMKLVLREDTKAMDDIKEMSDKRIKQLESVLSDTDDKHKVGQACNAFIAIKRVEDNIVSFTDDLQSLQQRNTIRKYKFKPDDQLLELMSGHTIGMLLQPSKYKQECAMGPTKTPANKSDVKCHTPKAVESQCFKDGKPVIRKTASDRLNNESNSIIVEESALNNMKLPDRTGSPDVSQKLHNGGNTNVTSGASLTKDKTNETTGTPDENDAETRQNHQSQDDANETTDILDENDAETRQIHQSQDDANETTDIPDENDAETRQNHQSQDDVNVTTDIPDENEIETRQNPQSQDNGNETTNTHDENDVETRQHHQTQYGAIDTTNTSDKNDAETLRNHHSQYEANETSETSSGKTEKSILDVRSENDEGSKNNEHCKTVGNNAETDVLSTELGEATAKVNLGGQSYTWNANACYDLRGNQRPTNNKSISDASSSANKTEYTPDGEQHWNTCQRTVSRETGSAETGKTSDNDIKKRRKELKTANECRRNARVSNESLPNKAPETPTLELQICGYDTNAEFAKSDIEKKFKHDLPKSQSTVYMSLPPEVSELLKDERCQHTGNLNVNIGTRINNNNAPLSPMTDDSNAATNRPKNKDIFTCHTQERLSVKVYEADILSVNVDCIVNAANEDLKHVCGIALVIASKAGQDLIKECDNYTKQYGPLPVGRALRTSAGKLHYKCVIHAVGPCWNDYKPFTHESIQKCQKDLHDAVWYSLDIASRNHMSSVAFPAISSASFGVPRELCASEFAKSVMMYSKQRFGKRGHTLQEVCFVDTDPKTIQIIKETFNVMIKDQKPYPHSFMQYIVQKPTNQQHGQGGRAPEIPPKNRPHTNVETSNTFSYPLYIMSATETKCKYTDRHKLRIYTGDILNVRDADTIVCGEDISGSAKGYIAKCLKDVGKWEYVKGKNDAFSNTKPRTGDVVITHGGKSQFERIAHALVPHRQQFNSETEWKKSLRKMYDRIFGETSRAGSFSLVLPLLGTGATNTDLQPFIEIFLDSYVVACNRHQTNILTVSIVNIKEYNTRAIAEVFKKHIDKHRNYTSTDVHTDQANDLTRSRTGRYSGSFTPRTGHENIDKYAKNASAARPSRGHGRNGAGIDNKQKFAERSRRVQVDGCVICLDDKINNPKRLICGHTFCKNCIDSQFKVKPVCPTCSTVCGTITGDQPKGQMEISRSYLNLDGYDLKGSISITYIFPAGKQNSNHPQPGAQYTGLKRTAYIPDIEKGQKICAMLREAFNRKLVFTIGTSRTSGQDGVIIWNDIHHKTDMRSNAQYGYPDPKYFARVTDELKAKGVTESDIDQNFLRRLKTLKTGQKLHNF